MENLYEDKLPLQEPRGLSALLWLTGRFCCSAVVPYKFSLWKLSPSFCPSLSWQQIFISIKLSHSFASKLVDKLHSYKVTQDKLNGSKSHVTCDGDSRSRETCGHTEAPPLLPLLPPSLNFDLPCSWSPQDLVVLSVTDMRCCERQDESHVGLIKYSHSHTATHKVFPRWLMWACRLWREALYCFCFSFSMESLTRSMRGPKAWSCLSAKWPQVQNCQKSYRQTGKRSCYCLVLWHLCLLLPCASTLSHHPGWDQCYVSVSWYEWQLFTFIRELCIILKN